MVIFTRDICYLKKNYKSMYKMMIPDYGRCELCKKRLMKTFQIFRDAAGLHKFHKKCYYDFANSGKKPPKLIERKH